MEVSLPLTSFLIGTPPSEVGARRGASVGIISRVLWQGSPLSGVPGSGDLTGPSVISRHLPQPSAVRDSSCTGCEIGARPGSEPVQYCAEAVSMGEMIDIVGNNSSCSFIRHSKKIPYNLVQGVECYMPPAVTLTTPSIRSRPSPVMVLFL